MAGETEVQELRRAVRELDEGGVRPLVRKAISAGASTSEIKQEGLRAGMFDAGRKFESGEMFPAELDLLEEVVQKGLDALDASLPWEEERRAVVVLATVEGDLHDKGKNLGGLLLRNSGYEVVDLGVDVPPVRIAEAVRDEKADVLGLSAVLFSSRAKVRKTIEELEKQGLRDSVRVLVGGPALTPGQARESGADTYLVSVFDLPRTVEDLLAGN